MTNANRTRLALIRAKLAKTYDADLGRDGEPKHWVRVEEADLQGILAVIADECGREISDPVTEEEFDAVFGAISNVPNVTLRGELMDLWDIVDGWTHVKPYRDGDVLDILPSGYWLTDKSVIEEVASC